MKLSGKQWAIVAVLAMALCAGLMVYGGEHLRRRDRVRVLAEIDQLIQNGDYLAAESKTVQRLEEVRRSNLGRRSRWSLFKAMPFDPTVVRRLANIQYSQGRYKQALAAYRSILSVSTNDPSLKYRYAIALAQSEADGSALYVARNHVSEQLREEIARNLPTKNFATNDEPFILLSLLPYMGPAASETNAWVRETRNAIAMVTNYLGVETVGTWIARGNLARVAGDFATADDCYDRAILENSQLPSVHYFKALNLLKLAAPEKASAAFKRCKDLAPLRSFWRIASIQDQFLVDYLRNPALPDDGRLTLAVEELDAITQKAPDYFLAWRTLTSAAQRARKLELADKASVKALEMDPNEYELHLASVQIAQERDEVNEAIARMQRAVKRFPLWPRAQLELSRVQMANRQWVRALESLDELDKMLPESLSLARRIAEWQLIQGPKIDAVSKKLSGLREELAKSNVGAGGKGVAATRANNPGGGGAKGKGDGAGRESEVVDIGQDERKLELSKLEAQQGSLLNERYYFIGELQKRGLNSMDTLTLTNQLVGMNSLKEVFKAESNLQLGRSSTAMLAMEQFLSDPVNARSSSASAARLALAEAYRQEKRYGDAIAVYTQLIQESKSRDPRIPFSRGMIYREMGQAEPAKGEFELTLRMEPGHFGAMEQLVDLDIKAKRPEDAERRLKDALREYPSAGTLHYLMGRVHESRGQTSEMAAALKRSLRLTPGFPQARIALARHYLGAGDRASIPELVRPLVANRRQPLPDLLEVALIYDALKDYEQSRMLYERILRIDPSQTVAINNLSYLLAVEEGKLDEGMQVARGVQELVNTVPMAADTLGWIHYLRGDYMLALPLLLGVPEKIRPPMAELFYHLGMTHYMLCNESESATALTRALQVTNTFRGSDLARRCLEHLRIPNRGNPDAIRKQIEEALKTAKNDPVLVRRWVAVSGDLSREAVLEKLRQAAGEHPRIPALQIDLAEVLAREKGELNDAVALLESTRNWAGNDVRLYTQLGEALLRLDRPAAALPRILDGLRFSSGDPRLLLALGRAQFGTGEASNSGETWSRVVSQSADPAARDRAKILLQMLRLADDREEYSAADLRDAERLSQSEQDELLARYLSIRVKEAGGGAPDDVRRLYEGLMTAVQQFNYPLRRLAVMASKGAIPGREQDEIVSRARSAFPKDPMVALAQGIVHFRASGFLRGMPIFEEVLSNAPGDPEAMYWLGRSKAATGDRRGAVELFDRALQQNPKPTLRSNLLQERGKFR